ncbi:MAG: ABC transporter substrate-binding protein [Patescibacteria group bacterium]|nr:ABC transporter substrate-binding protein [Patescibacteria group bacterium]
MQQSRLLKLRFRRRLKLRQQQAKGLSTQAERSFERYVLKRLDRFKPVRRFVIGWTALLLVLMVGVIFQAFQLTHYYQTLRPVAGGTYREGILGTFSTANPLYASSDVDSTVAHLLFSGLFHFNQQNKLVGDLAESYEVNPNGTVYTVHLKPQLRWHDGQALTSADVLFTYQAIQNPDAQSPLKGSWQGITVSAPDPATVVFSLPGPLASFPNTMTNGIVPKHRLAKVPASELRTADFNTINPIGSGPFMWQAIQVSGNDPSTAEEQLALLPNAHYVGGKPKLARFIVHAYADRTKFVRDFQGGALTGAAGLTDLPTAVTKNSSLQVHNLLLTAGTYAFFKTTHPILNDQKVRLALVQAADPSDIIKHLTYPTKAVRGPLLQGQLASDPTVTQPKHDLAAAKVALDAAGWVVSSNGIRSKDKHPLTLNLVATDTVEYHAVTKALQKQWLALGVKLNVRLQSVQNFQNTLAYHDYDIVLYGISIGTDPDVFVYWDSSQADIRSTNRLNLSEYKNLTADASLESGRTRLDPALRTLKYKPFLTAWQQDVPALGLYQPRVLYATNGPVNGLNDQTINTSTDRFNNVQNWMIREAKVTNK